jgi:hypothetical protein
MPNIPNSNGTVVLSEDQTILWLILKNFKVREAWGDPSKMNHLLLYLMDGFRSSLPNGCWIKVHCGYKEGGHTKNSFHYKGKAIDFHVVGISALEAEACLMHYLSQSKVIDGVEYQLLNYVGLGLYPEWANPGFHLDVRGKRASWARVGGAYVSYDLGLKQLGFLLT